MNRKQRRAAGMIGGGKESSAHTLVAQTAQEMAGALYEELAKNNDWYLLNPDQKEFIERTWGSLIEQARGVLAKMLGSPNTPEEQKELIAEALILDNSLVVGRGAKVKIYR